MKPIFKVVANNEDVTEMINLNSSKIEFKDEEGELSDEITLEFVGEYKKPKKDDEIKLWLGSEEEELFYCGLFLVNNSKYKRNDKTTIEVIATAANFSKGLKVKRNRTYENVSIRKVASIIAIKHELDLKCDYEDIYIDNLQQTNESDLSFLKRIAEQYNAIFSIKNNTLTFLKKIKDNKKSKDLPRFKLVVDEQTSVEIENTNKDMYNSCKAIWRDTKDNKEKSIIVGDGEPTKIIKDSFESMADAKVKAQAVLQKANSKTKVGTISCTGFAIYAGGILELSGTLEDDGDYHIKNVHHIQDENGWNMTIQIEN